MGEITLSDDFGQSIFSIVKALKLRKILEIGSWDGTGSTQCFIAALKEIEDNKELICLEPNLERFEQLRQVVALYPWIKAHNKNSISYHQLLDNSFDAIWTSQYNGMSKHITPPTYEQVSGWFAADVENIKKMRRGFLDGELQRFDGVLIDGSEFTGYSEYTLLKNYTNVFFLDDYYCAFKTHRIAKELEKDAEWDLVAANRYTRNGFAIFKRKQFIT